MFDVLILRVFFQFFGALALMCPWGLAFNAVLCRV